MAQATSQTLGGDRAGYGGGGNRFLGDARSHLRVDRTLILPLARGGDRRRS
ncbi:hypothetical protein NG791_00800 [Laspinema sp. D1]|uniref:hypothetical protein n=1 Tax=Laspinema palackyanum TaxID=3231601 RepID=UPI00348A5D1D|nr:hypothetical protein [Laspinema sp. D2b]